MRTFAAIGVLVFSAVSPWPVFGEGNSVVVVYNSGMPESRQLAEYYAEKRNVPSNQLFGFDLPRSEEISRADFREKLQLPLLNRLEEAGLFVPNPEIRGRGRRKAEEGTPGLAEAKVRYAVLCYGVPVKILSDPRLSEAGANRLPPELRRNEAAVDSELAVLPQHRLQPPLYGTLPNPAFGAANSALLHPTNGVFLVTRLDGPSVEVARGLVDKALQAEEDGLWGRAYFDARGLSGGEYQLGDDWIKGAAEVTRRVGVETFLDEAPETFPVHFPLSQVAFYAGWYDAHVSGPFTRPEVEFMPGAFAYHLHSFSAQSIRTPHQHWVGPLLDKGATATLGCVAEPYLEGSPNIALLLARLIFLGMTYGEAAYASQSVLSWQTTVVGDPLYRPFGKESPVLHQELAEKNSPLLEWSILRAINQNMIMGEPMERFAEMLGTVPEWRESAVLQEKLAEMNRGQAKLREAAAAYQRALSGNPSPQQRLRIMLAVGPLLRIYEGTETAYRHYEQFLETFPDYPGLPAIYQILIELATALEKEPDAERYQRELDQLSAEAR